MYLTNLTGHSCRNINRSIRLVGQAHVGTRASAQLPLMHCVGWEQAAPRPPRHSAATSRPPPPAATPSHVSRVRIHKEPDLLFDA